MCPMFPRPITVLPYQLVLVEVPVSHTAGLHSLVSRCFMAGIVVAVIGLTADVNGGLEYLR